MFGLGVTELVIILVIIIVVFGAAKLPQLGKGLGEGIRNFKKSVSEPDEIDVTPGKGEEKKAEEKKEESQ